MQNIHPERIPIDTRTGRHKVDIELAIKIPRNNKFPRIKGDITNF